MFIFAVEVPSLYGANVCKTVPDVPPHIESALAELEKAQEDLNEAVEKLLSAFSSCILLWQARLVSQNDCAFENEMGYRWRNMMGLFKQINFCRETFIVIERIATPLNRPADFS